MPFAGLSTTTRSAEDCQKSYDLVKTTLMAFLIQNAWTQPNAKTYVSKLLTEAPEAKQTGKLCVVTGVTIGGSGYEAALELALLGGFHVILLGRNETKLQAAMQAMEKEARKRGLDKPVLYETKFDLDSLESAKTAADFVSKLANEKYEGKLHVLLNNAGMVAANPVLTKDGFEANIGRNFMTVYYLTELLLPFLKKAATPDYKPRIVDAASIAHIFGVDFDPARLHEKPKQGGAPEGSILEDAEGVISFSNEMEGAQFQYGRAKMAVVAASIYLQTLHPELCFVALHPGSIASNFGGELGIAAKIYYYGFYFFQYTPKQGATAELRPCLDPDFNTAPDLQGAYLHCDGNPWVPHAPKTLNPATKEPYTIEEYGKATVEVADKLIEQALQV